MTPFYFGMRQRRLFGIYEPARTSSAHAAVLCNPWGNEYIHAYRSLRQLALLLTIAGFHILRFDYYGTGDSAGDMIDADVQGWKADIETAMDELRHITDLQQVTLVGLRLGATLAAAVAADRQSDVDELVLWDPVVSGPEYLAELGVVRGPQEVRSTPPVPRPAEAGGGHEVAGFPLTLQMSREFAALDLASLVPALPERSMIMASLQLHSHAALQQTLDGRAGVPLPLEYVATRPGWVAWPLGHVNAGTIPVKMLERIVEWLR